MPVSAGFGARAVARRKARLIRSSGRTLASLITSLGELPCGLDVGRVVEQDQGLKRRVGPAAADGAGLAVGGVEGRSSDGGGEVRFQNVYIVRR